MTPPTGKTSVSNAQLAERLDAFILQQEKANSETKEMMGQLLEKIQVFQVGQAVADTERHILEIKVDSNHKAIITEIDQLEGRVNGWSAINSIGAVVAVILGYFGLNK